MLTRNSVFFLALLCASQVHQSITSVVCLQWTIFLVLPVDYRYLWIVFNAQKRHELQQENGGENGLSEHRLPSIKQCILFEIFLQFFLPRLIQSCNQGKIILETCVQRCLWGEGRGRVCVNWETSQKFKSISRLLSMIVVCLHPSYQAQFSCHLQQIQAPSIRIRIFFNPLFFLSGFGFRPHVSGESCIRIRNFLNRLSRMEIFEYAMNLESCGR